MLATLAMLAIFERLSAGRCVVVFVVEPQVTWRFGCKRLGVGQLYKDCSYGEFHVECHVDEPLSLAGWF